MSKRYFVFLYPDDSHMQELLDLAIFVLNPSEKLQAHVTLAGPYTDRRRLPRNTLFSKKVSLFGVGQFRSEHQNTVFLHIGAKDLRDFWDKPDYPRFNPHLTLYDGSNSELSNRLYEILFEIRMYLHFFVSNLSIVSTQRGQGSWDLLSKVNLDIYPKFKGISIQNIIEFSIDERIFHGTEILKRAKYYSPLRR